MAERHNTDLNGDRAIPAAVQRVLDRLEGVRAVGTNQWEALCPAHDDRKPSLNISIGDHQPLLLYCHGGCTFEDILNALKLPRSVVGRLLDANHFRLSHLTHCRAAPYWKAGHRA